MRPSHGLSCSSLERAASKASDFTAFDHVGKAVIRTLYGFTVVQHGQSASLGSAPARPQVPPQGVYRARLAALGICTAPPMSLPLTIQVVICVLSVCSFLFGWEYVRIVSLASANGFVDSPEGNGPIEP